ncbi:MAG: hypothetical protein AAGG53_01660 [Cyanobacteria bacterium P01_H01_bin.152]
MTIRRASIWVFSLNILAIVVAFIIHHQGGRNPFGERGYITFLSVLQLLGIAWLAYKILQVKIRTTTLLPKSIKLFWWLIIGGFVFLAADEFLAIHEILDLLIHDVFNLQETPVTDRIDDAIVGLYGMFGAGMVWVYRRELISDKRALAFLKRGFWLLIVMIVIDVVSNDQGFLERFFLPETAELIQAYLYQIEDSFKVLSEAFFVLAFYTVLKVVEVEQKKLEHFRAVFQPVLEESVEH